MKRLGIYLIAALAVAAATAFACPCGTWTNVSVIHLAPSSSERQGPNGFYEVEFSAASTGAPSCSGANQWATIDISTTGGAALASLLTTAFLQGTSVTLTAFGSGACTYIGSVENLSYALE